MSSQSESSTPEREKGTVKWFSTEKDYRFIERDAGRDVFVHYTEILGSGFRTLYEGQRVEFVVLGTGRGLQATDVMLVCEW